MDQSTVGALFQVESEDLDGQLDTPLSVDTEHTER